MWLLYAFVTTFYLFNGHCIATFTTFHNVNILTMDAVQHAWYIGVLWYIFRSLLPLLVHSLAFLYVLHCSVHVLVGIIVIVYTADHGAADYADRKLCWQVLRVMSILATNYPDIFHGIKLAYKSRHYAIRCDPSTCPMLHFVIVTKMFRQFPYSHLCRCKLDKYFDITRLNECQHRTCPISVCIFIVRRYFYHEYVAVVLNTFQEQFCFY